MAANDRTPTAAELQRLLADWNTWLAAHTDSLLSLEERVQTTGSDADRADLAAAFVARKAIADRVAAIAAASGRDRAGAAALAAKPLTDDLGALIGNDLGDAAELLDRVLQKVENAVGAAETRQANEAELLRRASADLEVAERLASRLGMQVNHVAALRSRLASRSDLAGVAAAVLSTRSDLEAADRERTRLLQGAAAAAERMDELTATEARVRELAERCRQKVVQAPPLAVPSVAALEPPLDAAAVGDLPFAALRARVTPMLHRLDRVTAALAEAERRFREPLARRDELRGLLQAYGDKAAANGVLEHSDLDPMYREAKRVLWDAPCDLSLGARLVEQYVAAVNAKIVEVAK